MPVAIAVMRAALANVSRCARDYSVYLATLVLASCLLYSFAASGDYLAALGLNEGQLQAMERSRGTLEALSVFVVLVFAVLVAYATRFIVRRRSHELGTCALLGMRPAPLAAMMAAEQLAVGALALVAGVALGAALSPALGFTAALSFGVPWRLAWSFSAAAAWRCAAWLAAAEGLAVAASVADVLRRPLADLLGMGRAPERLRLVKGRPVAAQAALASALLAVTWGTCVLAPGLFVVAILPLGWAAYAATSLVVRLAAGCLPRWLRRSPGYWEGLRALVWRQAASRASSSCQALSCACVLLACAVCMVCAGLCLSVGMRAPGAVAPDAAAAASLAPIGFVGIYYGESFLVAAAAVLALQQLSQAGEARRAFAVLERLGVGAAEARAAVRAQVGIAFALPSGMALAHAAVGLTLVRAFARSVPDGVFLALSACSLAVAAAFLAAYYLLCVRECRRVLLGGWGRLARCPSGGAATGAS